MKTKIITLTLTLLFTFLLISCSSNSMIDKTVVKEFDINKYLGTWYELARYNHSFEKGLVGVTAQYSFKKDGMIKVKNSGFKGSFEGKKSVAIGKAKIPNLKTPAKIKVSFFWIFYADYYILELDKDYQWAIVGSKSDDYLWILSRKPIVSEEKYNNLLLLTKKRGYDINKLIKVLQKED